MNFKHQLLLEFDDGKEHSYRRTGVTINRYLNYLPNIATGQALISHEFVGILKNTFVGQSCFQIEDD